MESKNTFYSGMEYWNAFHTHEREKSNPRTDFRLLLSPGRSLGCLKTKGFIWSVLSSNSYFFSIRAYVWCESTGVDRGHIFLSTIMLRTATDGDNN